MKFRVQIIREAGRTEFANGDVNGTFEKDVLQNREVATLGEAIGFADRMKKEITRGYGLELPSIFDRGACTMWDGGIELADLTLAKNADGTFRVPTSQELAEYRADEACLFHVTLTAVIMQEEDVTVGAFNKAIDNWVCGRD